MKELCQPVRFGSTVRDVILSAGLCLSLSAFADVQPLEGKQMEDVFIMSTVTVRPTNDKSKTPYYDGGLEHKDIDKPSIADLQRQTTSTAVSRDLDDTLHSEIYTPHQAPPSFEERLISGLQSNGFVTGENNTLTNLPAGYTGSGSNGNYSITNPNGVNLQSTPSGLTIVLPNDGNFPSRISGGPDSPVSITVQDDKVILQLNNLK